MKIILFLILLACTTFTQAQTATASSGNTTAIAKVPPGQTKTTKSSVSISISDNNYSLQASFDKGKTKKLEKLLSDSMDNNLLTNDAGSKIWKKENKGETAYSVVLKEEKLKMSIDKELVSDETFERLKALGEKISETLSDKN